MNENHEMLDLLRSIEAQNRKQLSIERLRCVLSFLTMLCVVAVLVLIFSLMPQIRDTVTQIETLVIQFDGVMSQMGSVLSNLEQSTRQLADVDLAGMVTDVNTLVTTAQTSLEQTMQDLDAIDFEALNKAIKDLATVIEPLAKLTNIWK